MTITDNPISVSLDGDESITVPPGETWKVTIKATTSATGSDASIRINGLNISRRDETEHHSDLKPFNTVLIEGDTVLARNLIRCHIGGFVVN